MKSSEIRSSFLNFFRRNDHQILPSSALVPSNDPTLFFTNAGMVQFKDIFTGKEKRPCPRATTAQKCLRVSGKHNDLENVGRTPRHHTFFEMLGNFSFGDYFKRDAIRWSWEWITEILGISKERLWVTVHHTDQEAYDIWHDVMGVPANRIQRLGDKDNFWSMGETGPCGPCSEIHYDHGPAISSDESGPEGGDDRYVEIWNLVFMQYDRASDGSMKPLPSPSIDTGAGLERITAILQGVYSNYDTDCFAPIISRAASLSGVAYGRSPESDVALRVIADHSRAAAFLVADGIMPSNEERGYVLRRILRRAIRHGVTLGMKEPFLFKTADAVIDQMGDQYPQLLNRRSFILDVIRSEEIRFSDTLDKGLAMLHRAIDELPPGPRILDGDIVFRLYDTFGFPMDLTRLIAEEASVSIDEAGYEAAMKRQRAMGRAAWKGSGEQAVDLLFHQIAEQHPTGFDGYEGIEEESTIRALVSGGSPTDALEAGQEGLLIVDITPFYGEAGGQVGDTGTIEKGDGTLLRVTDTRRPMPDLFAHNVVVERGRVQVGDRVFLRIDDERRQLTRLNHTATHLLHAALKKVLGVHVAQKGSLVTPDRLRFDFSHHKAMSADERQQVESLVNSRILANLEVNTEIMDLDQARSTGAEALFGEKYGTCVRVVQVGDFSLELCGGTHATRSGDIGLFKIVTETSVAAGVRRIEALTGPGAFHQIREDSLVLEAACEHLRTSPDQLVAQIDRMHDERRRLERELEEIRRELARAASDRLLIEARAYGEMKVLSAEIQGDMNTLREEAERLRDRLGDRSVVVLGARDSDGVRLVATVSKALAGKTCHAGNLIREVARRVGGSGGGRPDMAQAGGKNPADLPAALELVYTLVAPA